MTYTQTNWIDGSTPLNRTNMMKIEDELALLDTRSPVPAPSYGASPPGSPVDGQQWYCSVASGITWQFRYNAGSASAYKWEYVGGTTLMALVPTAEATTATTWTDLPTPGPMVTVPRTGEYIVEWGAVITVSLANFGGACAPEVGGVMSPVYARFQAGSTGGHFTSVYTRWATYAINAGGNVKLMYTVWGAGGQTVTFDSRTLSVTPIRVS